MIHPSYHFRETFRPCEVAETDLILEWTLSTENPNWSLIFAQKRHIMHYDVSEGKWSPRHGQISQMREFGFCRSRKTTKHITNSWTSDSMEKSAMKFKVHLVSLTVKPAFFVEFHLVIDAIEDHSCTIRFSSIFNHQLHECFPKTSSSIIRVNDDVLDMAEICPTKEKLPFK
jgi:hypothetical protein